MAVKVEVFHSPTCPHCPKAISLLRDVKSELGDVLEVEEVNVIYPEGRDRALSYGISAVPTIVINGDRKIVGVPGRDELVSILLEEAGGSRK